MKILQEIFITFLNMSITASYVAIGVILMRILIKKAPKIFSYTLWSVVLFRLVCPLTFTSAFSVLGVLNVKLLNSQNNISAAEYVSNDIDLMETPVVHSGVDAFSNAANTGLPKANPTASVNPMQLWMTALSIIWLAVVIIFIIYSIISYVKVKKRLNTATIIKDNIFESGCISTAFVCGFIHPKIYVPLGVSDADISYILKHERTHIQRRDYLIKPFAFFVLILPISKNVF